MDMSYLKDKPIAVLGAGGVGKTLAGDCSLAGQKVRLWEQEDFAKRVFRNIESGIRLEGGQFSYFGFERRGVARVELATTNMADAIKGAGIIAITTVAMAHEKIFRELVPLLEDGQVIHLIPDNYGSFILRRIMREMKCDKKVIVGAWSTAPYGTRIVQMGGVTTNTCKINDRVTMFRGAALPDSDTEAFLESGKYITGYDAINDGCKHEGHGYFAAKTVIDANLSNVNPVIHVPGALLGAAVMQNFATVLGQDMKNYSLYGFALCPAIAEVQAVFWDEEKALAEAMGVDIHHVAYEDFFSRTTMYGKEYMGPDFAVPFEEKYPNFFGDGPFDLENRYITEDVPVGCYVYQQLAKKYGVATPVIDSMILIANIMLKRDLCAASKYTLEYLGIGHMTKEQLDNYLYNGVYTEK